MSQELPSPFKKNTPDEKSGVEMVTLGCRLNGWESDQMRALAKDAAIDDAVVINTCAVTNEAVRQARQSIRKMRKNNPEKQIIVTGCAAQIDPKSFEAMPEVDAVLGNENKMQADAWQNLKQGETHQHTDIMKLTSATPVELPQWDGEDEAQLGKSTAVKQHRARAFVQIQNGCDHRCTFCIIPFGRGNARSVAPKDIIAETQSLVDQGVKEVVLTGVDISSYGGDFNQPTENQPTEYNFETYQYPKLLGELARRILKDVPDLHRLRLSSIDVAEIDPILEEEIINNHRIAPYLHLSLQAGDNMILKRMKRRHNREDAIAFCQRLRSARPDIAFGADLIAGFPTETDAMHQQSLDLIVSCGLQYLHIFPYSAREGTPAARMPQVNGAVIKQRAAALRTKGDAALAQFLDQQGGDMEILTEKAKPTDIENGQGRGRLANFAEVIFDVAGLSANDQEKLQQPGQLLTGKMIGPDPSNRFLHAVVIDC